MKVVADDNTAANLMSSGALNIAAYGTNNWKRFKGQSGNTTVTQAQTDTMLIFNETPKHVTANQKIRLAIAQAINRQAINNVIGNGQGTLESNLGESSYACNDSSLSSLIPKADASAAGQVLKGVNLRIIGTTQLATGNGTSYLLAELRAAGATATLQNENNEAWVTQLFSGKNDWDLTILGYSNNTNSLLAVAGFFTGEAPPQGQNLGDVQEQDVNSNYTKAGQTTGAQSCQAIDALQQSLIKNNHVIPLSAVPTTIVFANHTIGAVVKGFVQPSSIRITNG